jgi:hypothetical protein
MRIVSLLLCAVATFALAGTAGAADPASSGAAVQDGTSGAPAPAAETPTAAAQPPPAAAKHKPALGPVGQDSSGQRGRVHTVASGDTLWDISEAYLGTPWVWPSIWQDNPAVPNPHRIFPGDKLWVSPTSMRRVTDAEAEALLAGQAEAVPAATEDAMPAPLGTLDVSRLASAGFVSADVLETAAAVLGTPHEEEMIAQERSLYVGLGEGQVQAGDRFDVVRVLEPVRDPETRRRIGHHVEALGWIEVTRVHAESSEAAVRMSMREIEVGDRILPRVETDTQVELRSDAPPVEGQIAFLADSRTITGGQDFVYLNRGSDHGLAVGSPLEVYRSHGVGRDGETGERRMLPDDVIGNVVVVSAEPNTAVALVLQSHREFERGDHFRGQSQP